MMFTDRREAGRALAARLRRMQRHRPVVLALPRGGVPVAYEIARALSAPLDLVLVRKIAAPGQPECAIGAIAEGSVPELVTDARMLGVLRVSDAYLQAARARELAEIARRRAAYLRGRPPVDIGGRLAILVDDGIATGWTMLAALRATRQRAPSRLVLAVPVASPDALERLRAEADEIVCLRTPADFMAVGQFYRHFPQLRDDEVTALLDAAAADGGDALG